MTNKKQSPFSYHLGFSTAFWLIQAQRLLGQIIACRLIGPSATAAAHFDKFTPAALTAVFAKIAQITKYFRALPNIREALLEHIAAIKFQITAGLNLADMGNKAKGNAT
jgi:hypothetical protein